MKRLNSYVNQSNIFGFNFLEFVLLSVYDRSQVTFLSLTNICSQIVKKIRLESLTNTNIKILNVNFLAKKTSKVNGVVIDSILLSMS